MEKNGFIDAENMAMATDLYQLTMAASYYDNEMKDKTATFELFVRKLPENREYLVATGLEQAIDYLLNLKFAKEDIDFLKELPQFKNASNEFWKYLAGFKFTGELRAVPEGSVVFEKEPLLTITAPIIEAQLVETYLLATINFQTMIATKAAKIKNASREKPFIDFGMRRAHSAQAGVLAARAAYIGGADGTSCVLAGKEFGIPIKGTMAHSWIMANETEEDAFRKYAEVFPDTTTALVDTYDTLRGTEKAINALGDKLKGVRVDSGSLDEIVANAKEIREMLDKNGLQKTKIFVSGDMNEQKIAELESKTKLIDAYGVGTELVTSKDAPTLGGVYKLVEIDGEPKMKLSNGKATLPGKKQIFRFIKGEGMGHVYMKKDVIGLADEKFRERDNHTVDELLKPILVDGKLAENATLWYGTENAKKNAQEWLSQIYFPDSFKGVFVSKKLKELEQKIINGG